MHAQKLRLEVGPDAGLAIFLIAVYLMALLAIMAFAEPILALMLLPPVALIGFWQYRSAYARYKSGIWFIDVSSIEIVMQGPGDARQSISRERSLILGSWVLLASDSFWTPQLFLLRPGPVNAEQLRRLRVLLRWGDLGDQSVPGVSTVSVASASSSG